jgi:hypothetical protein
MKNSIINNLRVFPRDQEFLDRKLGSRGEIFYDQTLKTLRVFDGAQLGGYSLAKNDLTNVENSTFRAKAAAAGVASSTGGGFDLTIVADDSTARPITTGNSIQFSGGSGIATSSTADGEIVITNTQSNFSNIAVAGQSTVSADSGNDTVTLVAGSNILITTDATTDVITISAAVGASTNSFATVSVAGGSNLVADSTTDTLTLVAGTGISISGDASTDTITITNSGTATTFNGLSDIVTANLTIDQIYLQAITRLNVTNIGVTAYRFDQYTGNNPSLFVLTGTTIAFNLQTPGLSMLIQDATALEYSVGLVHVSTTGVVSTGSSAQGKDSGTLYWKIPDGISGTYRYQCSGRIAMVGAIFVKSFSVI